MTCRTLTDLVLCLAVSLCLGSACGHDDMAGDCAATKIDLQIGDSGSERTLTQRCEYLSIGLPLNAGATWDEVPVFDGPNILETRGHSEEPGRASYYQIYGVSNGTTHVTILGRVPGQNTNRTWQVTVHVAVPEWGS